MLPYIAYMDPMGKEMDSPKIMLMLLKTKRTERERDPQLMFIVWQKP